MTRKRSFVVAVVTLVVLGVAAVAIAAGRWPSPEQQVSPTISPGVPTYTTTAFEYAPRATPTPSQQANPVTHSKPAVYTAKSATCSKVTFPEVGAVYIGGHEYDVFTVKQTLNWCWGGQGNIKSYSYTHVCTTPFWSVWVCGGWTLDAPIGGGIGQPWVYVRGRFTVTAPAIFAANYPWIAETGRQGDYSIDWG